jgi:hypothetical protein
MHRFEPVVRLNSSDFRLLGIIFELKGGIIMNRNSLETIGVRYTAWAALNRDPLEDRVEFTCPQCGAKGTKAARRPRAAYHFTDGFVQDLEGEAATCRDCKLSLRVAPVVMLHDQDETRRFKAVFELEPVSNN